MDRTQKKKNNVSNITQAQKDKHVFIYKWILAVKSIITKSQLVKKRSLGGIYIYDIKYSFLIRENRKDLPGGMAKILRSTNVTI